MKTEAAKFCTHKDGKDNRAKEKKYGDKGRRFREHELKISEKFLASGVQRRRGYFVVIGILVEIPGVAGRTDLGNNRGSHGPGDQGLPVESLEPLVLANVGGAGLQVSETLGAVGLQKSATKRVREMQK